VAGGQSEDEKARELKAMSRIGKKPIPLPAGVEVAVAGPKVSIKGPKGSLQMQLTGAVSAEVDVQAKEVRIRCGTDLRADRAKHGLYRALLANMVVGVTKGYEKRLRIEGIGYQARMDADKKSVILTVGFANPIKKTPPDGVTVEVAAESTIVVKGADKQKVGQFAAEVRAVRKPEPYKGKGIRYENEQVRRKEGKSFTSGG
jgi:large subunit ribosomal protein L6